MSKWNVVGFLTVNALCLGFLAEAAPSTAMKIFGYVLAAFNGLVALNGAFIKQR
jgi:hypothetical protein